MNKFKSANEEISMKILVFAPHNDDEILGVGGTIRKYIKESHDVYVCEITSGARKELLQSEARSAHNLLGIKESIFLNIPVGTVSKMDQFELNNKINDVVTRIRPDIVFLPFTGDMHMDHGAVAESAMVSLRPIGDYSVREIYMYETLSETGWNFPTSEKSFTPNTWIDITDTIDEKISAMKCYKSQILQYPHPRSIESIIALAQYRGATVGVEYAESFVLVRKVIR